MAQVPHIRDAGQEHAQPMRMIENSHKMNSSEEILAEPRQDSGDTPQGIAWIEHGIRDYRGTATMQDLLFLLGNAP